MGISQPIILQDPIDVVTAFCSKGQRIWFLGIGKNGNK